MLNYKVTGAYVEINELEVVALNLYNDLICLGDTFQIMDQYPFDLTWTSRNDGYRTHDPSDPNNPNFVFSIACLR